MRLKPVAFVDLSYKLTKDLALNTAVNHGLDKNLSDVKRYQVRRNSTHAGYYYQTAQFTTR